MTIRRGQQAVGLWGLLLAFAYGAHTLTTLSFGTPARPGPAIFPTAVALLLLVTSVGLLLERSEASGESVPLPRGRELRRLLLVLGVLAGLAVGIPSLGYLPAGTLAILLLLRALRQESWPRSLLLAVVLAGATWALFVLGLGVPLPSGPWRL